MHYEFYILCSKNTRINRISAFVEIKGTKCENGGTAEFPTNNAKKCNFNIKCLYKIPNANLFFLSLKYQVYLCKCSFETRGTCRVSVTTAMLYVLSVFVLQETLGRNNGTLRLHIPSDIHYVPH